MTKKSPRTPDEGERFVRPLDPRPVGARDLEPDAVRRRRTITSTLLETFERWGYEPVLPPALEYAEVLGRGLGEEERARTIRFIEPGTGELVSLRSDVTPQIARMIANRTQSGRGAGVHRLCYAADVVRLPDSRRVRAELHQVGAEFIGDGEPAADAELVAMVDAALGSCGSDAHRIVLSHSGLLRAIIAALSPAPGAEAELRERLARKDAEGLARVARTLKVSKAKVEAIVALSRLHGSTDVVGRARGVLEPFGAAAASALDRLEAVVVGLELVQPKLLERVSIDLGEPRGLDYYTGLRFRIWAAGVNAPIVRGGRYDEMLGNYGADLPATGLAVDLEGLERALQERRVAPEGSGAAATMIAVKSAADHTARREGHLRARRIRARGGRAWVDVDLDDAAARAQAEEVGAKRLVLLAAKRGSTLSEREFRRVASGWKAVERKKKGKRS